MLAAGKPDSAVGWLIVSREIALLAAELGRVHRARGELDRAQQIETELGAELAQIEAALERERPRTGEVLDAEAQAAKRAREPLPPPARDPGRQGAGETEDVKRLINPLRGRRRQGAVGRDTRTWGRRTAPCSWRRARRMGRVDRLLLSLSGRSLGFPY